MPVPRNKGINLSILNRYKAKTKNKKLKGKNIMKMKTNKGFSLVELIVVIAIMAILTGVAVPVFSHYIEKANINKDKSMIADLANSILVVSQDMTLNSVEQLASEGVKIPMGFVIISRNGTEVLQNGGTEIDQMLKIAYGENYSEEIYLNSANWTSTIPSFYKNIGTLYDSLETGALLGQIGSGINAFGFDGTGKFGKEYESSAEVAGDICNAVVLLGEETFVTNWMNLSNTGANTSISNGVYYKFGLDSSSLGEYKDLRAVYSAVRAAYSSCFASYMETQKKLTDISDSEFENHKSHIAKIKGYSSTEYISNNLLNFVIQTAVAVIPGLSSSGLTGQPLNICRNAFEQENTTSQKKDSYHLPDDVKNCDECKAVYEKYVTSDTKICEENARAFWGTMKSMQSSYNDAVASGNFFDYYESKIDSTAEVYKQLNEKVKALDSYVVATVYCENNIVTVEILPPEADARND